MKIQWLISSRKVLRFLKTNSTSPSYIGWPMVVSLPSKKSMSSKTTSYPNSLDIGTSIASLGNSTCTAFTSHARTPARISLVILSFLEDRLNCCILWKERSRSKKVGKKRLEWPRCHLPPRKKIAKMWNLLTLSPKNHYNPSHLSPTSRSISPKKPQRKFYPPRPK